MESSTVLVFRIFVMLSCLIIVPMAAIFGSAFPDVVKSVLVDRLVALGTGKTAEPARDDEAAEGFSELRPAEASAPAGKGDWEAPRWGAHPAPAAPWPGQTVSAQGLPGATPEHAPQGGHPPGSNPGTDAAGRDRMAADAAHHGAALENAGHVRSPFSVSPASASLPAQEAIPANVPVPPLESPDRFTAMERKLREYGATYYLLETWGKEGDLYRFHCKMAIGNSTANTRHFEATDRDALTAMSQVLERVEAWRAGRVQ